MAKTVDQFSTLENFRTRYNDLAIDVGDISGLRTDVQGNIIDAINSIEDKTFFYKKKFFLGTGKEVFDLHIDLYKEFLKDHLEDVSCLVELGAGYGSKILNLSQHNEFKHLPPCKASRIGVGKFVRGKPG